MAEYIDIQVAIDEIYKRCAGEHWEDILRSLEPAKVRPVVGHDWKEIRLDIPTNFCPYCGSNLRGGDSK